MALRGRTSTRRGYRLADREAPVLPVKEEKPVVAKSVPTKKKGFFSRKKK